MLACYNVMKALMLPTPPKLMAAPWPRRCQIILPSSTGLLPLTYNPRLVLCVSEWGVKVKSPPPPGWIHPRSTRNVPSVKTDI